MPSTKKVRFFRFIEKASLILFIVWSVGMSFLYGINAISTNETLAGAGIALLLLLIIVFIQKTIDGWLETALSQSNYTQADVFTSLYDRSPVGYLTLDTKGKVSNSNPAAINLLNGEADSFKGINFYSLIGSEEQSDVGILESKVEAGMTVSDEEMPIQTLDGQIVWVMLSVFPYRNAGERLVSLVDITDQKNVDTAKSEFVALATHQLRTPIAAIRWNVELLDRSLKDIKTEAQSRYLTKVERNVLRMINLINDFLSVSKLEMGTYAAEEAEINLTDFFASITEEFAEKINEKQITINQEMNPENLVVSADSRLIHIIVSNLMSNAVKYSKTNGRVDFSYFLADESVVITVADDGIGVPEGELSSLFTKFYRASNAQSHQTEGTGLGLYIVKQSVEQMNGTVTVESSEDNGTKFVISLPVSVVSS